MIPAELRTQYREAAERVAAQAPEVTRDSDVAHGLRALFAGFADEVAASRAADLPAAADRDRAA